MSAVVALCSASTQAPHVTRPGSARHRGSFRFLKAGGLALAPFMETRGPGPGSRSPPGSSRHSSEGRSAARLRRRVNVVTDGGRDLSASGGRRWTACERGTLRRGVKLRSAQSGRTVCRVGAGARANGYWVTSSFHTRLDLDGGVRSGRHKRAARPSNQRRRKGSARPWT